MIGDNMTERKLKNKKPTTKVKKNNIKPSLKLANSDKVDFPFKQFPVKVIHLDGKNLMDKKTCYFQNEEYAKKYIQRCNFKKKDYFIFVKNK